MLKLKEGLLISIEGIDGSGKTTLAKNLYTKLQENFDVLLTKEPGDTNLGKSIRAIIQTNKEFFSSKAEFLLFAADRAQHFEELVIPALKNKKLVISDRLADSSMVYQGYGRNLNKQLIEITNKWAMNDIVPDITIYVEIPVATALQRIVQRNETISSFEHEQFLKKVADGFEDLYQNHNNVIRVNGSDNMQTITEHTYFLVKSWIHQNNLIL